MTNETALTFSGITAIAPTRSPYQNYLAKMESEKSKTTAMAWIVYSESDVGWLLSRIDEFLEAGQRVVAELNARIDAAPDSAKPVFRGLAETT